MLRERRLPKKLLGKLPAMTVRFISNIPPLLSFWASAGRRERRISAGWRATLLAVIDSRLTRNLIPSVCINYESVFVFGCVHQWLIEMPAEIPMVAALAMLGQNAPLGWHPDWRFAHTCAPHKTQTKRFLRKTKKRNLHFIVILSSAHARSVRISARRKAILLAALSKNTGHRRKAALMQETGVHLCASTVKAFLCSSVSVSG